MGFETASRPWDSLTASRIEAQQARTSETLALVLRSSEEDTMVRFSSSINSIEMALQDYEDALNDEDVEVTDPELIHSARAAAEQWRGTHDKLMGALKDGDYDEAIYQATATEPKDGEMTTARSYDELDAELSDLISQARVAMRSYLERGLTADCRSTSNAPPTPRPRFACLRLRRAASGFLRCPLYPATGGARRAGP